MSARESVAETVERICGDKDACPPRPRPGPNTLRALEHFSRGLPASELDAEAFWAWSDWVRNGVVA